LLGIHQIFGQLWSWFGHQGWEFLELGRFWQIILVIGFSFWIWLLYRAIAPAMKDPERKEVALLFMGGAAAIPFFYLPAFFFGKEIRDDGILAQRAQSQRRDEFARGFRQHARHAMPSLRELAGEVRRLVGRDGAGDAEDDA
jgi:glucose dehydrogenase